MKKLSLFLLLALCLFSCREEVDIMETPSGPEPKIVVNGSVFGQVLDQEGNALADATVIFQNQSSVSDEYGIFSFTDTNLFQDGTYVRVQKEGYITGSRLFYPEVNETSHIVVQLIQKNIIDVVPATTGGMVSFDGATVTFPANGFVNDDGSDYTGNVNVIAKWLNPEAPETFNEMPGDLVGINSDNQARALATYGMIAVELEDQSGNHLQLKDGFTADIQVPVPAAMQANAPSEIPLWHFDMESGYWIEEGSAQLINGIYEGEVSHFSFWNCDAPFPLIQLSGIVTINNQGLENVKIRITDQSSGFSGCGYTTSRGFFSGKVPQDQTLTLEVIDDCGNVIYTDSNVGPFSTDQMLPLITISNNNNPVTISGTVDNCLGTTINNSYVLVQFDNGSTKNYQVEANGTFSFTIINCNSGTATIYGVDLTNDLISAGVVIDLNQDINVGTLEACDEHIADKFIIDYAGSTWNNTSDSLAYSYQTQIFNDKVIYQITGLNWTNSQVTNIAFALENGATTANWTGDFADVGFTCNGMDAEAGIKVNNLGQSYLFISGSTTDITVTNSSLFNTAITEIIVNINIPL